MNIEHKRSDARHGPLIPQEISTRRARRWRRVAWLTFLVAVLGALAWVILRPHEGAQPRRRFAGNGTMPVVASPVQKGDIDITLNALGTVTPLATVTVRTQIAGQLTKVGFQEGQNVHAGDFLAQIDSRPYERQLGQYQGQLMRDQALLKDAQLNLERYRTLVAQNSIARQQYDTQASLVQQYEGAVETDKALIETAKLNIAYCHIDAPVTGRVGLRQVDPGNYVQTSDPNGIVVITQLQPITVIFTLPEDNLPAVLRQMKEGTPLTVTAFDRTGTTKLAEGQLTTVDNQIDPATGTVKLRATFGNEEGMLFPNQFVNVKLLVQTLRDVTVIPTAAVQRGAPGTFVYLVNPDDTVSVRPIKLGPISGERVEVASGLESGQQVVVDGADKLREGAKVSLPAANKEGPASGGQGPGPQGKPGAGHGLRRAVPPDQAGTERPRRRPQ